MKSKFTNLWRLGILLMFYSLVAAQAFAQSKEVTGSVISSLDNSPLPGVSVVLKGTQNGVITDVNGKYSINIPNGDQTLVFSFIGSITQEVQVGSQSVIDVTLENSTNELDEVIVVAYGTAKKTDMTGSVGTVKADEIAKFNAPNSTSLLQNRIAGVRVSSQGGAPNANPTVTIRGLGTLSDNGPLFVIDGMLTDGMGNLNPNDIETISVLKDASASALYGSRAANGVVLITTKKGKEGFQVSFDSNIGIQTPIKYLDWANAREYADIVNRARTNDGNPTFPANDANFNPNIDSDIQRESLRSAPMSTLGLTVSSGNKNATANFSVFHIKNVGIVKESDYQRTNLRFNSAYNKGRLTVQQTLGFGYSITNPNDYFNSERDMIPTIPLKDAEGNWTATNVPAGSTAALGTWAGVGNAQNTLAIATIQDRTVKASNLLGNIDASFKVAEGLKYKYNVGYTLNNSNNFTFTPSYFHNATPLGNKPFNEINETNANSSSILQEHTLNYNKKISQFGFDLLAGYSSQVSRYKSLGVIARSTPSNEIRVASAAADRAAMPSFESIVGLISYFGRLNLSYDERYLITTTLRRDGSSLFKENNRWGLFPSAAFAWNIGNEDFMSNQAAITNLRFRASYGEIGSNNAAAYSTDPVLNLNSQYILGESQIRVDGNSITNGVNPNLKWETTKTTDIGIEFNTLKDRLAITMDYFIKNSEDVIIGLNLPLYTGFGNRIPFNTASVNNKGFEFSADYLGNQGKDFTYNIQGNFAVLNNVVTSIGPNPPIIEGQFTSNGLKSTRTAVDAPIGAFYGYRVVGIYQTDEEADAANDFNKPQAGDLKFADLNGDGKIDNEDQEYLGNPVPKFTFGLNFSGSYKNLDFTTFFDGVAGNKILNGVRYRGYFDTEGNYLADALNGWTPSNTDTDIPRNTQTDPGFNRRFSDFYLEDGSFFRLRNVQLGYTFEKDLIQKIGLTNARLYVMSQNLLTFTKYSGYYPEVARNNRTSPRILAEGVDESSYPTPRNYQLGLQISF